MALFSIALEEDDIQNIMNNGLENLFAPGAVTYGDKLATTWGGIRQ